jgi:hypothetical protein
VVEALRLRKFTNIALVKPKKDAAAADIFCEKNGHRVCCEVKAITKQSSGRKGLFMLDQLYEKILESVSKARTQLTATATKLQCGVTVFVCAVNWFSQSIYLNQDDYQHLVNRLEKDQARASLAGIDGVLFVTKMGLQYWFLNERAKCIDC